MDEEKILKNSGKTSGVSYKAAKLLNEVGSKFPDEQSLFRLKRLVSPKGKFSSSLNKQLEHLSDQEKIWVQAVSKLNKGEKIALSIILNIATDIFMFDCCCVGDIRRNTVFFLMFPSHLPCISRHKHLSKTSAAFIKCVFKTNL